MKEGACLLCVANMYVVLMEIGMYFVGGAVVETPHCSL